VASLLKAPPHITSSQPPGGMVGTPYAHTYTATGSALIVFTDSGGLPPGLTLSPVGVLFGTPTEAGHYTGMVTASNQMLPSDTQPFAIDIIADGPDAAVSDLPGTGQGGCVIGNRRATPTSLLGLLILIGLLPARRQRGNQTRKKLCAVSES
jgi:Putative Ig domain